MTTAPDTPPAGPRHAVYWAPRPDHPLWQAGCQWLGRDPADQARPPGPPPLDRAEPWRYGFHATLKPPMHLIAQRDLLRMHSQQGQHKQLDHLDHPNPQAQPVLAALQAALAALAAAHAPIPLPPLQLASLGGFLALRLAHTPTALQALADGCVQQFDRFRAPMSPAELARRAAGLDAAQLDRLQCWGYPHVLAGWRFHMTLSDVLPDGLARTELAQAASQHFAPALAAPLAVQDICLFEEPAAGQPLRLVQRFALGGQ